MNSPSTRVDKASDRFIYGINLVQTKMDNSVRRGAIVKAMAIFSRHHHTDMFKEALEVALEAYFDQKDISVLEKLYKTMNALDLKSVPLPNILQQAVFTREVACHSDNTNATFLDRWTYRIEGFECFGSQLSLCYPFYRSPDEICVTNVRRLVKVLGAATMRVFHALITRQRILFIGYNHAAADVSSLVLSCTAMVSPPIPNVIRRTYPYASLSDLAFMETEGFIAGVTNPMFQQMDKQWDLICVLDLPNDTCQVMSADEKRIEDAIAKGKPLPSKRTSSSTANEMGGEGVVEEHDDVDVTAHESMDQHVLTRIIAGVVVNQFSEFWTLTQFRNYTRLILDQALDLRYTSSDGEWQGQYITTPEKKKTFREKARSLREKIRNTTGGVDGTKSLQPSSSNALDTLKDTGIKTSSESDSTNPDLHEIGAECDDNSSSSTNAVGDGWSLVKKTYTLSEKTKKLFAANDYRAKILSDSKEVSVMTIDPWAWTIKSSSEGTEYDHLYLRSQVRRIVCEVEIPVKCILEIYGDLYENLTAEEDLNIVESRLHALLSVLPAPSPSSSSVVSLDSSSEGGLEYIAVGLFHYHAKVRRLTLDILKCFGKFASTSYLVQGLNRMYLVAYQKGLKQLEDGSLLTDEQLEVQIDIRLAKRQAEKEKDILEEKLAWEQLVKEQQEQNDHEFQQIEEQVVENIIEPIGNVVNVVGGAVSGSLNVLFKGIDDLEQHNAMMNPDDSDDPALSLHSYS